MMNRIAVALALLLVAASAYAADNQQAARAEIGKPVQQAQVLVKQKKFAEALAKLHEADAVGNKSPYENYVIEETRAAAALDSSDYPTGAKALEAVIATGILSPSDTTQRIATLVSVELQLKDYAKVVDLANRYYKDGGSDPAPRQAMAQAYYLEGDFPDAAKTFRVLAIADERAGKQPEENRLLALANSSFKAGDQAGYIDALERLASSYPKPQYWVDLCRAVAQKPSFDRPRRALDLDRLEAVTGAVNTPEQYVDMAELALADGFPGDAKAFLDKGYAEGVLGKGPGAERQKRLAELAKRQSDEDMTGLAAQAKEAEAAVNGIASEKLGEAYLSYGRYDEAVSALTSSLKKGGLKDLESAKLHLGLAYLRVGQQPNAKDILNSVTGDDGAKDLSRLWLIHGGVR